MRPQLWLCVSLTFAVLPFLCAGRSIETRMESLEQIVQVLQTALVEKDNTISQLENQLSVLNERVNSLERDTNGEKMKNDLENERINFKTKNMFKGNNGEEIVSKNPTKQNKSDGGQMNSKTRRLLNPSAFTSRSAEFPNIAFHAYQSHDRAYNTHETILFDSTAINLGNGYNSGDGIFVAPVTGVYAFAWTVVSNIHTHHEAELIINGRIRGSAFADSQDSTDDHQATGLIVAQVNQGDHVFCRIGTNTGGIVISNDNYGRTTFTGWLLFTM